MLLVPNNASIKAIIVEIALLLYEKLIRMDDLLWKNYSVGPRNLKTQNAFIQSVQVIRIEYELPDNIQEFAGPSNLLEIAHTQINLNLGVTLYKSDTSTDVMKCFAYEAIHLNYPVSE